MTRHDRRRPAHAERRSQRRVAASRLPLLSAQLSGGAHVSLLDVSQGGVRLETTRHMRPGQRVSMRFSVDDRVITVTASVVRAAVVHVHPEEVRYETGLRLGESLACESLDIALFERRADAGAPAGDAGRDVIADLPSDLVFLPAPPSSEDAGATSRGWWLASRRRSLMLDESSRS